MSLLVVDKLTLEKYKDSRKSRRPNFKMGVSPRVVDWLTQEVYQGSRKSRSKFSKCVCRKRQLTG
jgi:D-Tyr-tRNAtyr deacylase